MAKRSPITRAPSITGIGPTADWGVPDWRDASAYPKDPLTDASPQFLNLARGFFADCDMMHRVLRRWELLRRKEEYRTDWTRLSGRKVDGSGKYGLVVGFPDPRVPRPWPLMFDELIGIDPGIVFAGQYTFDLSRRLGPQFKHAALVMRAAQRRLCAEEGLRPAFVRLQKRERLAKDLPRLLRALDAREAGATFIEIGRVIIHHGKVDANSVMTDTALGSLGKKLHLRALELQELLAPIHPKRPVDRYAVKRGSLTGIFSVMIRGHSPAHEAGDESPS